MLNEPQDEEHTLLGKRPAPAGDGPLAAHLHHGDDARVVLWQGSARRLVLLDPKMFARKAALVILGSYALIPLLASKSMMPAGLYLTLLAVIHVAVLIVYCYRVKLRSLDFDRMSLGARVLGLLVVTWLLSVVSGWQDHDDLLKLSAQMLVLCAVHTVALALLMVAMEPTEQVHHGG